MIFVEAPAFERIRERYLDDDQYRLLQLTLMANPESGDLIRGSGGIRKVRWAAHGKGKRGGLRVMPSRTQEFHPRALTDPYETVSRHTARATR
jgi:hypothetical protein